jgi:hypothetical protein
MSTRGHSPNADPVGIDIVFECIGSKPSDRSLAIFDLRWKRYDLCKTVINAGDRISFVYDPNSPTSRFSASVPAAP